MTDTIGGVTFGDRIGHSAAAPGLGDITLGGALPGHRTLTDAGVSVGDVVPVLIEADDASAWETCSMEVLAGGVLLRGSFEASSTGSPVDFTSSVSVRVVASTSLLSHLVQLPPQPHASTHAIAGSDPITPSAIGAAAASHTHTVGDIVSVSSGHLVGRHAGGTGVAQQVNIDGGLELQGANLRRQALTGDVTASAGSNSTTIANNAVTTAKINDLAVTEGKIAASAVTNAKQANMAAGTVKANLTASPAAPSDVTLVDLAAALPVSIPEDFSLIQAGNYGAPGWVYGAGAQTPPAFAAGDSRLLPFFLSRSIAVESVQLDVSVAGGLCDVSIWECDVVPPGSTGGDSGIRPTTRLANVTGVPVDAITASIEVSIPVTLPGGSWYAVVITADSVVTMRGVLLYAPGFKTFRSGQAAGSDHVVTSFTCATGYPCPTPWNGIVIRTLSNGSRGFRTPCVLSWRAV